MSIDCKKTEINKIIFPECDNHLFIKREDLLPFSFGGNKARIALEYLNDMRLKDCTCMIGYGSSGSNLNRALANLCSREGIPCHIVSPFEDGEKWDDTMNSRIVELCNGIFHKCPKSEVAITIEHLLSDVSKQGLRPYYMNGDKFGRGNEAVPVAAYTKVYRQIPTNEYDYIFLPVGTGMTYAGLLAGKLLYGGRSQIVGLSIARNTEKATNEVSRFVEAYLQRVGVSCEFASEIHIDDAGLYGGYGQFSEEVVSVIRKMLRYNGVPMDTTYTGKAFTSMIKYLNRQNIIGKKILFIHTGGTPLFFDKLEGVKTI